MSLFYAITSISAIIGVIYVWVRVIRYLPLPVPARWFIVALFLLASQNMLILRKLTATALPQELVTQLGLAAGIIQAFEITLFALCVLLDVLLLFIWLGRRAMLPVFPDISPRSFPVRSSRSGLRKRAVGLVCLGLIFSGLGIYEGMRVPIIKEQPLPIAGLPSELKGVRLALLADMHIGAGLCGAWLQKVVSAVNAQQVDAVFIVGDVVDGSVERIYAEVKHLGELKAPHGVFLVVGNHEYYSDYRDWVAAFKRMGLTVLTNEHKLLHINGYELAVSGVTDDAAARFSEPPLPDLVQARVGVPGKAVNILLRHRPDIAAQAAALGYAAQLSGHTHGGQLIFLYPLVKLWHKYVLGLYDVNGMSLYVTPGTGVWARFPIRLGTIPEITILTLVKK
jgi:predicted MPP superfamily phosphohydrolase